MEKNYSPALCQYLGDAELRAFDSVDSFEKYMVFKKALESLSASGLSSEDSDLARRILDLRLEKTRPWNLGRASGESGEAD